VITVTPQQEVKPGGATRNERTTLYHAIINKEITSDVLTVRKELLCLLCILEIRGHSLEELWPCFARLDVPNAFPEPPFAHWGPAPNIDIAVVPKQRSWATMKDPASAFPFPI